MRDLAVLALADDLSGAAETAAALLSPALRADIALADSAAAHDAHNAQNGARALVIDLDTRQSGPDRAAAAISRALAQHGRGDPQVLVKIDSLLRGNLAATVPAVGPAVFAPALPVGGRTVVDGVVRVHGVPLHETTAWGAENDPPPTSVAAAVAAPCRLISLAEVRSDPRAAIAESLAAERVPVCDAETDSDLDAVVTAALALPGVGLIGSGGLAAAVGRAWRGGNSLPANEIALGSDRAVLVVVGTADPGATVQVRRLVEAGVQAVDLDVDRLAHAEPFPDEIERIASAVRKQPTVLRLDAPRGVDPAFARTLVQRLAETVRRVVTTVEDGGEDAVALVLTGGETARRVLDALDVHALHPIAQVHHGAVHSRTADARSVVTRPGSFGDPDSLVRIVRHLRPLFPSLPTTSPEPVPGPTEG